MKIYQSERIVDELSKILRERGVKAFLESLLDILYNNGIYVNTLKIVLFRAVDQREGPGSPSISVEMLLDGYVADIDIHNDGTIVFTVKPICECREKEG